MGRIGSSRKSVREPNGTEGSSGRSVREPTGTDGAAGEVSLGSTGTEGAVGEVSQGAERERVPEGLEQAVGEVEVEGAGVGVDRQDEVFVEGDEGFAGRAGG